MRDIMIVKNVKVIIGDGYRMDKGDSDLRVWEMSGVWFWKCEYVCF